MCVCACACAFVIIMQGSMPLRGDIKHNLMRNTDRQLGHKKKHYYSRRTPNMLKGFIFSAFSEKTWREICLFAFLLGLHQKIDSARLFLLNFETKVCSPLS